MLANMVIALIVVALSSLQGRSLLKNPEFLGPSGWQPIWSREPGTATVQMSNGVATITATGEKDWSLAQTDQVPVQPGEIFEIGGKFEGVHLDGATLSVVCRTRDDQVLDWSYGALNLRGDLHQKVLRRKFVIPDNCAKIQFRMIGTGPHRVAFSQPFLLKTGSRPTGQRVPKPVTLETQQSKFEVRSDGSLRFRSQGQSWETGPLDSALTVVGLQAVSKREVKATIRDLETDDEATVAYRMAESIPEVSITTTGNGITSESFTAVGRWKTQANEQLIVPMNEGIMFPTDDSTVEPLDLVTYGGHGVCMPWFGVTRGVTGAGLMTTVNTPDDAMFEMRRHEGLLGIRPVWQSSRGTLRYPRMVTISLLKTGGYVAMAKQYRAYAKKTALWSPLTEKRKLVPAVDRLVGAINVWNWDMNPVEVCKELQAVGIQRILWSRGGNASELTTLNDMGILTSRYDIYQDVWDPKVALPWMNSKGWPDDLVLHQDGSWMKGWAHPDKQSDGTIKWLQGGVICSERGLQRAKEFIPNELKTLPYRCRFIDTTTASPWRECYNPLHPLTRSDDRKYKMALLGYISKDLKQVVGTETGIDPSVPFVHYYEGMLSLGPYRLPDAGTDMIAYRKPTADFLKYQVGAYYRLPLWELVYHDCTVAQWYWGDASNKAPEVWDQRDLLNMLYGTAPLVMFDKSKLAAQKIRMVQTYRNVCEWVRKVGYSELVSHQFLTEDHQVQRSTFANGHSITVNFGATEWKGIPAKGWLTK